MTKKHQKKVKEQSSTMSAEENEEIIAAMLQNSAAAAIQNDHRMVFLHGDVNEYSVSQVIGQLLWYASVDTERPVHLIISTYGGSVDEMFSLYDTIGFMPCPVHTIALGKVMSAGVLLLAAGEKGQRLIGKSSRIMMHGLSGGSQGSVFDMMNSAKEHQRQSDLVAEKIAFETKMSVKKVKEIMTMPHDYYITPEQALKYGIVDKLIGR